MKLNKSPHIYGRYNTIMSLRISLFTAIIMLSQTLSAQSGDMAPDFLRSVGKIYVVAGVTLIILVTLFIFLISLDRKISRLEKRHKNE